MPNAIAAAKKKLPEKDAKSPKKEKRKRCNFSSGIGIKLCVKTIMAMHIADRNMNDFCECIWDFKLKNSKTKARKDANMRNKKK